MSTKKFIEIDGAERTTPGLLPPPGYRDFYPKSDGWYELDSAGVERKVSNDIPGETGVQTYAAVLIGANGSFTSATVGHTDFDGTIVWARSAEGVYTGTLTGAFVADQTFGFVQLGTATEGVVTKFVRTSADVVTLSTFLVTDGTTAADFIGSLQVLILVYPLIVT